MTKQASVDALKKLGVVIEPEWHAPQDLCRACVWALAAEQIYRKRHLEQVGEFDLLDTDDVDEESTWISRAWLREWHKVQPKFHERGTLIDPNPSVLEFRADVECEHRQLQPDPKRRKAISVKVGSSTAPPRNMRLSPFPATQAARYLEAIFSGWEMTSLTAPCAECEEADERLADAIHQEQSNKLQEKRALKSLVDVGQDKLYTGLILLERENFVIPRAWARQWALWVKTKEGSNTRAKPGRIDNSPFLCEHGLLSVDLAQENRSPKMFAVVDEAEWRYLQHA